MVVKLSEAGEIDCPVEQKVIETIRDLRGDGMSFNKIAKILTKMGVPTKTKRKKWRGGSVRSILVAK